MIHEFGLFNILNLVILLSILVNYIYSIKTSRERIKYKDSQIEMWTNRYDSLFDKFIELGYQDKLGNDFKFCVNEDVFVNGNKEACYLIVGRQEESLGGGKYVRQYKLDIPTDRKWYDEKELS